MSPVFLSFSSCVSVADSQSFIGVNYGQVADNLPPPPSTAALLQSTSIAKIRLYGADPAVIKALANTGVGIVIGAANGDIPALASNPNSAAQWIATNVVPYYPASDILLVTVGNEVMSSMDQSLISQLLPAMRNVQNALNSANLGGKVRVSTVHSMAVLSQSDPPSSGRFNPLFQDAMKALLDFQKENGSPFAINPYPFFAYQSDPRAETLAFCLFQPNSGRVDSGTGIKYMNMFDAQVSGPLSNSLHCKILIQINNYFQILFCPQRPATYTLSQQTRYLDCDTCQNLNFTSAQSCSVELLETSQTTSLFFVGLLMVLFNYSFLQIKL